MCLLCSPLLFGNSVPGKCLFKTSFFQMDQIHGGVRRPHSECSLFTLVMFTDTKCVTIRCYSWIGHLNPILQTGISTTFKILPVPNTSYSDSPPSSLLGSSSHWFSTSLACSSCSPSPAVGAPA